jgi:hypothetical protein
MPVAVLGNEPVIIQPTEHAKYLGVWLDKQLSFTLHRKKLLAKAAGSLEALRGILGSTWGASLMAMRKIYQAVVIPQALWSISAWYCPVARALPAGEILKLVNKLTKLQKRAAILISGAFKSMAAAAINIELFLFRIKLRLQQTIEERAIRILAGPQWACPRSAIIARKPRERKIGGWSPIEAWAWKGPLKVAKGHTDKCGEVGNKNCICVASMGATVQCIVEPSETALASHDALYKRTQENANTSMV